MALKVLGCIAFYSRHETYVALRVSTSLTSFETAPYNRVLEELIRDEKHMSYKGLTITEVETDSIAEAVGITAGDRLISLNGQEVRVLLDYRFFVGEEALIVELAKSNGEVWEVDIEKDLDEDLGLSLKEMKIHQCPNKCVFCFVDQMPEGQREGLYIRDEDYRFSFLFGNYITLTNLTRRDKARIFEMHLSPLYISVHTTDPALRRKLLENPRARDILEAISEMAEHRIAMHTQIVLCPDLNDGDALQKSVKDLANLHPSVISLALVPVGVTRHRKGLPELKEVTAEYACEVLALIADWQQRFKIELGTAFVFPADEWYVIAGLPFPELDAYEDLQQLENGVGMVPLFLSDFTAFPPAEAWNTGNPLTIFLITGTSFGDILKRCLERVQIKHVHLELVTVTVAGLLTGSDIIRAMQEEKYLQAEPRKKKILIIPSVMLDDSGQRFLDGSLPLDVEQALNIPIEIVPPEALGFINALEKIIQSYSCELANDSIPFVR